MAILVRLTQTATPLIRAHPTSDNSEIAPHSAAEKAGCRTAVMVALFLVFGSLVACTANLHKAQCGWMTSIPKDGTSLCNMAYKTLRFVAIEEGRGDAAAIRRLVPMPGIAAKILRAGRRWRREGLQFLRITPSLILTPESRHRLLVSLYLVGKTGEGKIAETEVVTLARRGRLFNVVGDQGQQSW